MLASASAAAYPSSASLSAGLLVGLMLIAAIVGGVVARAVRVPKVVGYLLAGLLLRYLLIAGYTRAHGAETATLMLDEAADPLGALKALALGLILFTVSQVLEVKHVRAVGRQFARISLAETLCVMLLVGAVCAVVWHFTGGGGASVIAAGLLLGVVAVATAPSATLLVLQEYDAKGPLSDAMLTLTAFNCTICIVLFHMLYLLLASLGVIAPTTTVGRLLWLDLAMTTVGSAMLGCILGFLFSVLYAKVTLSEFLLVFLAALIGLGSGADALSAALHLSFNFMLTCLFMGMVFTNVTLNSGPAFDLLKTMGAPLYAVFFVLAGFELHLDDVGSLGLLGACYVGMRVLGKYLGIRLGTRWARWTGEIGPHAGLGMLCQAGVAIGLTDFLADAWRVSDDPGAEPHPLALQFETVVLGSVVLFELFGPLVLKNVVKRAGEVKAVTLLRRARPAPLEGESVLRQTWAALLRTFGKDRAPVKRAEANLHVRDIMRANVKFLRAAATLDEVLHFVEASKYNHFPVVNDTGGFVGMIHYADLREVMYDPHLRELVTAIDLAKPDDFVPEDMPLAELLEAFHRRDLGSLAVVKSRDERRVVGQVEQRDLLRVLRGESAS